MAPHGSLDAKPSGQPSRQERQQQGDDATSNGGEGPAAPMAEFVGGDSQPQPSVVQGKAEAGAAARQQQQGNRALQPITNTGSEFEFRPAAGVLVR